MSWLWANDTTEQAQIVVSALQGELDERDVKIKALEAALRREQQGLQQIVQDEIAELEERRARIEAELAEVNALIQEKQDIIKKANKTPKKSKKKSGSSTPSAAAAVEANGVVSTPKKKKKAAAVATPTAAAAAAGEADVTAAVAKSPAAAEAKKKSTKKPVVAALPMDEQLAKIHKLEPNVAFIIQRSTNANTVVYAAQLVGKALDPTKPLGVFWIMFEKPGAPREDLNMVERNTAYGVSCAPSTGNKEQYNVTLASLKDRETTLLIDAHGRIQARTTIGGKPGMVLRRVFVQMTSSWGIPTVDYVELFGVDPESLASVYEKKANK